ncbi:MAG: metallophosphoesterase [Clostridiales Family XIII bacterium]|jgi:predicted phosphohydrolase|nr:metallophosphoesterase [Clostridiales Family XIII bacterium]
MSIFAIGDLHLSFSSGEKNMDVFGGEWVGHAERIESDWRRQVSEGDTVIVAGDISWALKQRDAEIDLMWIASLPGRKVLIKGNHDLWWSSAGRLNRLDPSLYFLQNTCYEAEGVAICGSRGWACPDGDGYGCTAHDAKIYARELFRLELSLKAAEDAGLSTKLAVLHFPPTNDSHEASGFTELMRAYGVKKAVYGHLHGDERHRKGLRGEYMGTEYILVSLDYLRCRLLKIW